MYVSACARPGVHDFDQQSKLCRAMLIWLITEVVGEEFIIPSPDESVVKRRRNTTGEDITKVALEDLHRNRNLPVSGVPDTPGTSAPALGAGTWLYLHRNIYLKGVGRLR